MTTVTICKCKSLSWLLLSLLVVSGCWGGLNPARAAEADQTPGEPGVDRPIVNMTDLRRGLCPTEVPGVSSSQISQQGLTLPSLWWTRDLFAAVAQYRSKLVETWLACPAIAAQPQQVYLVVNPQLWSLLDYLERYQFVNQFGTGASFYNYDVQVVNRQGRSLARYACAANRDVAQNRAVPQPPSTKPEASSSCDLLIFNASGRNSSQGRSTQNDAPFPTGTGTGQP